MPNTEILTAFISYMQENNLSENTAQTYAGHVKRYWSWCGDTYGEAPALLYRSNMLEFKSYLANVGKRAPVTINAYLAALNTYNDFLIADGRQDEHVFRKRDYIRVQTEISNPWDKEEKDIQKLRQRVLTDDKRHGKRNYAIITLMAYTGVRASEAAGVYLEDVYFLSGELLIRNGKGNMSRVVTMNDKVVHALEEYLEERGNYPDSSYLFMSQKGNCLQRGQIYRIVQKHSEGQLHPHMLRHFYCTKTQEVGYQLFETAQQAGHKDPRTTMRYAHPSKKEMREKANRM